MGCFRAAGGERGYPSQHDKLFQKSIGCSASRSIGNYRFDLIWLSAVRARLLVDRGKQPCPIRVRPLRSKTKLQGIAYSRVEPEKLRISGAEDGSVANFT